MEKYQLYKQSGVEWIGEIPSHWDFIKTNILTENLDGKRVPLNSEERGEMEGEYPYWGSNGIVDYINQYIFNEEIVLVGEDGSPFFDKLKDVSFYVNEPVWVNNHIHILKPKDRILPKYLTHSFNCVDYKEYITGSTRDKLTQSDLKRISHCVPPLSEQHQIVQYLDSKTELIDKLISTKERKITLLKEQRKSLINQVVTKGLNSNIKMKDSGIEWIGKIPEDWDLVPFKYEIQILTDYTSNGSFKSLSDNVEYLESGFSRLVRLTDLRVNLTNQGIYLSEDSHNYLKKSELFGGEILISCVGYYTGIVFKMFSGMGKCSLGPNMYLIRNKVRTSNVDFLVYLLNSEVIQHGLLHGINKTTQEKINKDNVKDLKIVRPPIIEQIKIVNYLDLKTKEIDDLVQLEQKKIDLLKEYRQSLISEVVTGKIKVTTDE